MTLQGPSLPPPAHKMRFEGSSPAVWFILSTQKLVWTMGTTVSCSSSMDVSFPVFPQPEVSVKRYFINISPAHHRHALAGQQGWCQCLEDRQDWKSKDPLVLLEINHESWIMLQNTKFQQGDIICGSVEVFMDKNLADPDLFPGIRWILRILLTFHRILALYSYMCVFKREISIYLHHMTF